MNELTKINPKEFGLEVENVKSIEAAFKPKIIERDGLEIIYKQIISEDLTKDLCSSAGELRRKLVKVRTGIAAIHKTQKAFFLASGRYVDAWKNKETLPITQMEENLMKIEKHFELLEKLRLTELQEKRVNELSKYVEDANERDSSSMDADVWSAFLSTKKRNYQEQIEAEKKAEQDRIEADRAFKAEQKRIRDENEQLKKDAIKNERLEKIAAEKRQKIEKQRLAKQEAERKEYELKLQKQREEKEKIERELKAKQEAELKAKEEKENQLQAELGKGDSEKVNDLISDLSNLKSKYTFKSKKNKDKYTSVGIFIDKIINHIKK